MPRLVLYNYWRSSSSQRVRIALALKGVAYEYVSVNLLEGEQTGAAHRARSATGYVPCLSVDGVPYVESVAIVELLEELFPSPPLYPRDAHGRARVRALVEIINSGTQPLQNLRVLKALEGVGQDAERQQAWLHHHVGRGLASFERAMEEAAREGVTGSFAYGDSPGAADAFLVPQVDAAKRFKLDLGAYPRVAAAHEAALALEPFQRAAPGRQPDSPKN
ncbi:MAG TPA: maleylacetoacetate isomerase [Polyangiaceae bacterium]|nr:maleylacetoacetate isomerase [Polyangiaceae bacterium]